MDDAKLKIQYLKVNFIGLAMIGSVFLYAGVVEVLKRAMAPFAGFAGLPVAQVLTLKYVFVAVPNGDFLHIK